MNLAIRIAFAIFGSWLLISSAPAGESESAQPQTALIKTSLGDLTVRLDWGKAPENSRAFVRYVKMGVYAKSSFDEIDKLVLHGGQPSQTYAGIARNGNMSPVDAPPGEFQLRNKKFAVGFRRTVGSCNPEKRSNCTQIWISLADKPANDGEFTVFGMIDVAPAVVEAIKERLLRKEPVPFHIQIQ